MRAVIRESLPFDRRKSTSDAEGIYSGRRSYGSSAGPLRFSHSVTRRDSEESATFEESGSAFKGLLWKHSFAKIKRARRYVVLSDHRIHCYKDRLKASIPGAGKTLVDLSDNVEAELGPPHLSRSRYKVHFDGAPSRRQKVVFYPIVIRKQNKGPIVVELFSDTEQVAAAWVRAINQLIKTDRGDQPAVQSPDTVQALDVDVGQLHKEFPALLAELDDLATRDRYFLASQTLEDISAKLKVAEQRVASLSEQSPEKADGERMVKEMRDRWEEAGDLRQNVLDMKDWGNEWLGNFDSTEGWKLVSDNGDMRISFRKAEGDSLITVRVDTEIDTPFIPLAAILAEADLAGDWIPFGKGTLVHKKTDLHVICHVGLFFPFFVPMSNRDWIIEGRGIDMLERKRILLVTKSITHSELCELPPIPKGTVRINLWGSFLITLLSPTRLRLQFITYADLQLPLSPKVLNFVNKTMGGQTIGTIRKFLKNFDHTKYPDRIKRRKEFYDDLQMRVDQCFQEEGRRELDNHVDFANGHLDDSLEQNGFRQGSSSGFDPSSNAPRLVSDGTPDASVVAWMPQERQRRSMFLLTSTLAVILVGMLAVLVSISLNWLSLPEELLNQEGLFMMLMAIEWTSLALFMFAIVAAYVLGYWSGNSREYSNGVERNEDAGITSMGVRPAQHGFSREASPHFSPHS